MTTEQLAERINAYFKNAPNRSYGKVPYNMSEEDWHMLRSALTARDELLRNLVRAYGDVAISENGSPLDVLQGFAETARAILAKEPK